MKKYSPATYARDLQLLTHFRAQAKNQQHEIKLLRNALATTNSLTFRASDQGPGVVNAMRKARQELNFHDSLKPTRTTIPL